MAVMLDGSQRDAVYQFVLLDLGSIGEMTSRVRRGELDRAKRLRQRFEEDTRLLDQIGWEQKGGREAYAVTLPSDDVRAIFKRLLEQATHVINEAMTEFADQVLAEAFGVAETSKMVLRELPGGSQCL